MGSTGYIAYPMCMRQYKLGTLSIISSSRIFRNDFKYSCDATRHDDVHLTQIRPQNYGQLSRMVLMKFVNRSFTGPKRQPDARQPLSDVAR